MSHADAFDAGRRRLLKTGALVIGFTMLPQARVFAQTTQAGEGAPVRIAKATQDLPGSLKTNPFLDAWIKIDPAGHVTVFTGKVELGTGIRTALLQVAADELRMAPSSITFLTADTALSPNEGVTAGSHTLADSGTALRNAAAQVRALLLDAAAQILGGDVATLRARNGVISAPDGRRVGYGDAVRRVDLHRFARSVSPLTDASQLSLIGTSLPRVDIPGKVTGGASYVQDMRPDGMVHARVVRPPVYGATLVHVDAHGVAALPGVLKVVRDGSYLAVVATDEWQAIRAQRALAASCVWSGGRALPRPDTIHATLRALPSRDIVIADTRGPAAPSVATVHATYTKPYLLHGSIGPSCAIALFSDTLAAARMTVWTHSQGVYPLRDSLAKMLSMADAQVRCIHVEGSGCYGHNGADDVAADAALIARAFPGRPVRVQWMREDEHRWDAFAPAMVTEASAKLDADGRITEWRYALWSSSHNERPSDPGKLMPTWALATPLVPLPPVPIPQPEGGGDRNGIPLYDVPNAHVVNHFIPAMPLRSSAMRGLGAHMNVFSIESFMDELADAAHTDPVAFRLRHLRDPRAIEVVRRAAQAFGWPARRASARAPGHGIGFGFARYKNLMAYMAIAVEIRVERETGDVRVERAVAAVDTGHIVSPDGVRNQIEGGILQSISWTLYEQLAYDAERIRSFDWGSYPIMRFSSVPTEVTVHLIDRPDTPFLGCGEAAMGPTAGAIANALRDATGQRFRDLPLAGEKLRRAIEI
ncbi:MAG: molybdopterin cofactor-binding domain-containing protein [Janthinobacterium lividum]